MILNCPSMFLQWRIPARTLCLASSTTGINTEQLREQLDHLHKEAQSTRAKANSTRLRFMRLSEAAEKLCQQAARSIQTGKENDARELLFQKKKVMQAMEKSKNRIELLDELSSKLSEVISLMETQLIGSVAVDLEVERDAPPTPVRIVSPKERYPNDSTERDNFDSLEANQDEELQGGPQSLVDIRNHNKSTGKEGLVGGDINNELDVVHSLKRISSYEEFLEQIDWELCNIESELVSFLRFSTVILESKEKLENSKVHHAEELLDDVCRIRRRIANIMQTEVGMG